MRTNVAQTAQLGDLVAAAFDEAAHYSTDPLEVSRLATRAVIRMLRHLSLLPAPSLQRHEAHERAWKVAHDNRSALRPHSA